MALQNAGIRPILRGCCESLLLTFPSPHSSTPVLIADTVLGNRVEWKVVDINDDETLSVTLGVAFRVLRDLITLHIMELGRLLCNATRVFHAINSS